MSATLLDSPCKPCNGWHDAMKQDILLTFSNDSLGWNWVIRHCLFPRLQFSNKSVLFQVMAGNPTADKPLPESMMTQFTHICTHYQIWIKWIVYSEKYNAYKRTKETHETLWHETSPCITGLVAGNPPVTALLHHWSLDSPHKGPVIWGSGVLFVVCVNKMSELAVIWDTIALMWSQCNLLYSWQQLTV